MKRIENPQPLALSALGALARRRIDQALLAAEPPANRLGRAEDLNKACRDSVDCLSVIGNVAVQLALESKGTPVAEDADLLAHIALSSQAVKSAPAGAELPPDVCWGALGTLAALVPIVDTNEFRPQVVKEAAFNVLTVSRRAEDAGLPGEVIRDAGVQAIRAVATDVGWLGAATMLNAHAASGPLLSALLTLNLPPGVAHN